MFNAREFGIEIKNQNLPYDGDLIILWVWSWVEIIIWGSSEMFYEKMW